GLLAERAGQRPLLDVGGAAGVDHVDPGVGQGEGLGVTAVELLGEGVGEEALLHVPPGAGVDGPHPGPAAAGGGGDRRGRGGGGRDGAGGGRGGRAGGGGAGGGGAARGGGRGRGRRGGGQRPRGHGERCPLGRGGPADDPRRLRPGCARRQRRRLAGEEAADARHERRRAQDRAAHEGTGVDLERATGALGAAGDDEVDRRARRTLAGPEHHRGGSRGRGGRQGQQANGDRGDQPAGPLH